MRQPEISVLLPAYNARRYLAPALSSILGQTFGDFELIVIDDGSTDRTPDILRQFARRDSRLRFIRRSHTGIVGALNEGLAAARGRFIARMDADDISLPRRFESQMETLRTHPEYLLVGSEVLLIDDAGLPISRMPTVVRTHERIDQALIEGGWPVVHPSVIMRTDAVRQIGAYRADCFPHEDHDLFLRLAEIGQLANHPRVLLQYRVHADSVSRQNSKRPGRHPAMTLCIEQACRRRGIAIPAPPPAPAQRPDPHLIWAWWALTSGNLRAARRHAAIHLRHAPLSAHSWRILARALRGR